MIIIGGTTLCSALRVNRFEAMAADLYACFAHQDEAAYAELAKITLQYFQGDLGEMLSDQDVAF